MEWFADHAHFGDELLSLLLMSCLFLSRLCKVVTKYSPILPLQKETDFVFCLNYFWKNFKMKLTIKYSNNSFSNQKLDAIIVFIFEDSDLTGSGLNSFPNALKKNLNTSLKLKVFTGKKDNCQQLFSGHANIPQILAVGVGKKDEMNSETLRRAAGKAGKSLRTGRLFAMAGRHLRGASTALPSRAKWAWVDYP